MAKRVYLDNAATTQPAPEVIEALTSMMKSDYGNPSSTHSYGRSAKGKLEQARRTIAKLINALPGEIIFTSGGTEADNIAIIRSVKDLGVKRIITSELEHHAVLHTVENCGIESHIKVIKTKIDEKGFVDINHLKELLEAEDTKTLVSLMHGNNEIGNLLPIDDVSELCAENNALFHSDTVQTMGHYPFDMQKQQIDFLTCGAHKLHGPKGVGFLFKRKNLDIKPIIQGGGQEAGKRPGTENIYGIVAMAKALEIAYDNHEKNKAHVLSIKKYMIEQLKAKIDGVQFNGGCTELDRSLYTVLNVQLPATTKSEMILFHLDLMGVAASGGSACGSGSLAGSHVIQSIKGDKSKPNIRFSFSKYNSTEDIDYAVQCIEKLYKT